MTRGHTLVIVLILAWSWTTVWAQKRPYDAVMKDISATVGSLRKSLDGGDLAKVAAGAQKLEGLFDETENFWTPFKTKDAIEAARGAREVSVSIVTAAKSTDAEKVKVAVADLGRFCTACHASHREQMPDKTYRIKP